MTYLDIVSKIWLVFVDVLYQVLFSKKLIIFFTNQSCLSKLYFDLWNNKESNKVNSLIYSSKILAGVLIFVLSLFYLILGTWR